MIRIEPAVAADFERVAPLFELFQNSRITPEQWRSLFHYSWACDRPERGFLLRDGDAIAGFIGTIWSERENAGRREWICNLTSWITRPEYRNQSLLLLKAVTGLSDCTITCLSPSAQLYPLYRRLGFSDLETKLRLIEPWPTGRCGWRCRITSDQERIATRLSAEDRRILQAHRPHRCRHLLVQRGDEYCYAIFTQTTGKLHPRAAYLHYLSNATVFLCALDRIKLHLLQTAGTPYIVLPGRLATGLEIPRSRNIALGVPFVFRSERLAPPQIDYLFSELILLGL